MANSSLRWLPFPRRLAIKMVVGFLVALYPILMARSIQETNWSSLGIPSEHPLLERASDSNNAFGISSFSSTVGVMHQQGPQQQRPIPSSSSLSNMTVASNSTALTSISANLYKSKAKGNVVIRRTPPPKQKFVVRGHINNNVSNMKTTMTASMNSTMSREALSQFYCHNLTLPDGTPYQIDPTKVWNDVDSDHKNVYPQWMKDYLNWHDFQRRTWSRETFYEKRWMVMQCLSSNNKCGGTSDRLRPILFQLKVAYLSKRILIVYWNKPFSLTKFLVPPRGGMDWRAPPWLVELIETRGIGRVSGKSTGGVVNAAISETPMFVLARMIMQDYHAGRYWYDEQLQPGEPNFETIFHHVWKIMFTPSAAVRQRLEQSMSEMGLLPYQYTAAHCRVLYAKDDSPQWQQQTWAENAVNCASELRPQLPIFFTSDSADATVYAQKYGQSRNATVQTRIPDPNPPLHIEFSGGWRPAVDYIDGFVDLYILAEATCITYNKGGYGVFGSLIGRNATCSLRQDAIDRPKIHDPCHWTDEDPSTSANKNTRHHYVPRTPGVTYGPIYLPPMDKEEKPWKH